MIVISGLGAIGSVYATALQDAGFDVRVAVDASRLASYSNNNLVFNDKEYVFNYFVPQKGDQIADLVIVATKASGYLDALNTIKPIVGAKTKILPLLNGITSEQIAADVFGWDNVVYGYFIGHTATRNGRNVYQDGSYRTVFGDKINDLDNLSSKVKEIKDIFDVSSIKYRIDEDMESSLWQKFVINIGLNQTTAYYKKNYGEIREDASAKSFMITLMSEAQLIAQALGVLNAENFVKIGIETLDKMQGSDSSSMLQDVLAGRPTEVEMFAGEICRLGEKLNINTNANKLIDSVLK